MIILVLGGTRSGKSVIGEQLAAAAGSAVTYLATAWVNPDDDDHRRRIEIHQARRPATWTTIDCPRPRDLIEALATPGPVLVDSLGTWVSGHDDLDIDPTDLVAALEARTDPTIIISEEVGWSVHPPTEIGRRYVDTVGLVNQAVAAVADRVVLVVAGKVLELGDLDGGELSC